MLLFVGCLTSQQHASVSQGQTCSDKLTRCYAKIEVADQTFYLTQSRYTDTRPTSPTADPAAPGAWKGIRWSVSHWYDSTRKKTFASGIRIPDLPLTRQMPQPLGQQNSPGFENVDLHEMDKAPRDLPYVSIS